MRTRILVLPVVAVASVVLGASVVLSGIGSPDTADTTRPVRVALTDILAAHPGTGVTPHDLKTYWVDTIQNAAGRRRVDTAAAIFRQVPSVLDGKPVEKLSALEKTNGRFLRNPDCWAPVDLTAISACEFDGSPDKQRWTARLGVTLISPRHVIMAKHSNLGLAEVVFISSTDREVRRKVIRVEPVLTDAREEDGSPVYADFCIGLLDRPIDKKTDAVDYARILPIDYIPSAKTGVLSPFLPVLHTNQDREVKALDWVWAGRRGSKYDLFFTVPTELELSSYYKTARGGDSGSPIFTTINGQLVVLAVFHTPVQGSAVLPLRKEINAVMARLQRRTGDGDIFELQEPDCTGFIRPQISSGAAP